MDLLCCVIEDKLVLVVTNTQTHSRNTAHSHGTCKKLYFNNDDDDVLMCSRMNGYIWHATRTPILNSSTVMHSLLFIICLLLI